MAVLERDHLDTENREIDSFTNCSGSCVLRVPAPSLETATMVVLKWLRHNHPGVCVKTRIQSADHKHHGVAGRGWSLKAVSDFPGDSDAPSGVESTELAQLTHFTDEETAAYGRYKVCPSDTFRTRTQSS